MIAAAGPASLTDRTAEDEPFLFRLFQEIHASEYQVQAGAAQIGGAYVSAVPELDRLLALQFRGQELSYARQSPAARDCLVWVGGERAGRLLVERTPESMQLVDISVVVSLRGQGLGSLLIAELIAEATTDRVPLRLFVRAANPAVRLYRRLGFAVTESDGINLAMELRPRSTAFVVGL